MAGDVPQLFGDVRRQGGQQLHHRLQGFAVGPGLGHRRVLLFYQDVVTLHQRGQGRVEAEVAQVFGDALDGFVAQAFDGLAFASLFIADLALNPVVADDAPEAIQEAPDAF